MSKLRLKPSDIMLATSMPPGMSGEPDPNAPDREDVEFEPSDSQGDQDQDKDSKDDKSGKGKSDKEDKSDKDDKSKDSKGKGDKSDKEEPEDSDDKEGEGSGEGEPEEEPEKEKDSKGKGKSKEDDKAEPEDSDSGEGEPEKDSSGEGEPEDSEPQDDGEGDGDSSDDSDSDSDSDSKSKGDTKPSSRPSDASHSSAVDGDDDDSDSQDGDGDGEPEDGDEPEEMSDEDVEKSLKDSIENLKGNLSHILKSRTHEKSMVGSHDEKGNLKDELSKKPLEPELDKLPDNQPQMKNGQELDPEQEDQEQKSVDQELNNMLSDAVNNLSDSEEEVLNAIEDDKAARQAGNKAGGVGLSSIDMPDKSSITHSETMNIVGKWIKKLKGDKVERTDWFSDTPSRKIKGLWGREMEAPSEQDTRNKVLLFVFDVSPSMEPYKKLMASICSDIAIKLTKDSVVNKVAMINLEGVWSSPKKFEPITGIKQRMRSFLKLATWSDLEPVWKAIRLLIKQERNKMKELTGIVIVSDFELNNMTIPPDIAAFNPSILAINISDGDYWVKNFIRHNPKSAVFGIWVHGRVVKMVNALKIGGKK